MGGFYDSMVILESRVWGFERVVEDMVYDLFISFSRRGGSFRLGYEGFFNRFGRYSSYLDYGGRFFFGERFFFFEGVFLSMRGRGLFWRFDF